MSGHSKWANIKRKKEINDKAKSSAFAKLSRAITLAVLEGGGHTDPEANVKLRLAVEKAREMNMPKDNIQRAIEKGSGPNKEDIKHVLYEAFAPGGAALVIVGTTDNPNRTSSEVRNIIERKGGKIASQGAVSYLFQQCGTLAFELTNNSENEVMLFAERVDATDFEEDSDYITVYFPFEQIGKIKEQLGSLKASSPEVIYRPLTTIELNHDMSQKVIDLMEALEELDDVQSVFTNGIFLQ